MVFQSLFLLLVLQEEIISPPNPFPNLSIPPPRHHLSISILLSPPPNLSIPPPPRHFICKLFFPLNSLPRPLSIRRNSCFYSVHYLRSFNSIPPRHAHKLPLYCLFLLFYPPLLSFCIHKIQSPPHLYCI